MSYYTLHSQLAVRQIERKGVKAVIKGGIAVMAQSFETITVELLFDAMINNEFLIKGSRITFPGDSEVRPWNGKKMIHEGVEFVLAPYSEALMVAEPEQK